MQLIILFAFISGVFGHAMEFPQNEKIGTRPKDGFSWQSCGTSSDQFQVSSVIMAPYPAQSGQNVTVHSQGYQDETISGGTWDTKIYWHGFEVQEDSGSVCILIPNCPCPCPAGHYTTSQSLYVTSLAPSGQYTGKYVATDQNGAELACISYTFEIA